MATTKHEGLRAVYNARRELYCIDKERGEMLRKIVKKKCTPRPWS